MLYTFLPNIICFLIHLKFCGLSPPSPLPQIIHVLNSPRCFTRGRFAQSVDFCALQCFVEYCQSFRHSSYGQCIFFSVFKTTSVAQWLAFWPRVEKIVGSSPGRVRPKTIKLILSLVFSSSSSSYIMAIVFSSPSSKPHRWHNGQRSGLEWGRLWVRAPVGSDQRL